MTTSRPLYEHRQFGWAMVGMSAVPLLGYLVTLAMAPAWHRATPWPLVPGIALVTLVVLVGFSSLSVMVTTTHVVLRFGIGLFRRSYPLEKIAAVTPTTTRWYEGWGVHYTRQGMLYNVQGFEAVRIDLVGGKSLRVGSDEAKRLCNAITRAIERRKGLARTA
jgi:hypothetical protein